MNDICDYINGKGESNRIKTGENVLNALDSIHPGEGSAIVNELIDQIREWYYGCAKNTCFGKVKMELEHIKSQKEISMNCYIH